MKFDAFEDPGHMWVKVPREMLEELGITNKISSFSYQRQNHVYLEEDCDFPAFYSAMEEKGRAVVLRRQYSNKSSKIRGYDRYSVGPVYVKTTFPV